MNFSKRTLIILAGILVVVATAIAIFFGSSESPKPAPTIIPTESPSPTPGAEVFDEDHGADGKAGSRSFGKRFPVMRQLPHETMYWSVELASPDLKDGTIDLLATVYITPRAQEQTEIRKQRRYIDAWLKKVGQQPGTYELKVKTSKIDSY